MLLILFVIYILQVFIATLVDPCFCYKRVFRPQWSNHLLLYACL